MAAAAASSSSCSRKYLITLLLMFSMYFQNAKICDALKTFVFEMHHRFSEHVKSIMGGDGLPEKGSLEYYAAMAHRDKVIRGRILAKDNDDDSSKLVTFSEGNQTFYLPLFGDLHYASVSLGIPSKSFLVALDTGSDLFWVPCDCTSCVPSILTSYGPVTNFNIYNSNSSATSKEVSCNNSLCELQRGCSEPSSQCPYQVIYGDNSFSSGVLVDDIFHLTVEDHEPKDIDTRIIFGCGQNGSYLDTGAPNGLLGLGMGNTSVPSILSKQGLIENSFSMCFGFDGVGRINFGDRGSLDQDETPFNHAETTHYEVNVTQLSVGTNLSDLHFSAVFDSGTSITMLNDPAYTAICEAFDAQASHNRRDSDPRNPFEYCYDVSSNSTELFLPNVTLIMEGGRQFIVYGTIAVISSNVQTATTYCLAVVRSPDVNIIGQNFMAGYHIVFDRERMVLGWKASDCYETVDPSTHPKIPQIPKESPISINVQPRFVYGGPPPGNGLNSRATQFSVGKPAGFLYLIASSLFMLCFPIL